MGRHTVQSRAVTLFGREPAFWVGLIEAVLAALLTFQIGVSAEVLGAVMGVVVAAGGAYTAWATKDTMLGAIVGLAKALFVLIAAFGLTLTVEQSGALIAVLTVVLGGWQRTQTSPIGDPVDPSPTQVTESPVGVSAVTGTG